MDPATLSITLAKDRIKVLSLVAKHLKTKLRDKVLMHTQPKVL